MFKNYENCILVSKNPTCSVDIFINPGIFFELKTCKSILHQTTHVSPVNFGETVNDFTKIALQ